MSRILVTVCAMATFGLSTPQETAKIWIGHTAEIEHYLRTAPIVRTEATERGVTRPIRAFFATGGPIASMTWKALTPGHAKGFHESYKSEIAAYEIDKLLDLNMVPPRVEREIDGTVGVAVMWVEGAKSFAQMGGAPKAPAAELENWNRQLSRAKMFHNLVGDIDPNLGNWLVDSSWNVILIDQSRALTTTRDLVHEMQRIDRPLWQRMQALTEDELSRDVGRWLDRGQIRALLARRDRMQKEIDKLLKKYGAAVWIG